MRELIVLGTASQAPTRHRNHNGYLLRWDGEGLLFDPGEGTQRVLTHFSQRYPDTTRHRDEATEVFGGLSEDSARIPVSASIMTLSPNDGCGVTPRGTTCR